MLWVILESLCRFCIKGGDCNPEDVDSVPMTLYIDRLGGVLGEFDNAVDCFWTSCSLRIPVLTFCCVPPFVPRFVVSN